MFDTMSLFQFGLVYNSFSFGIAVFGAATLFFWLNRGEVAPAYRTAVTISGLVTAIALYHYFRISMSWNEAFVVEDGVVAAGQVGFNDAYRYVDWLLTVPLLLVELILVMKLSPAETRSKAFRLGGLAALMVVLGYPGEISADPTTRWVFWGLACLPFAWIVWELYVGLGRSIAAQPASAQGLVKSARDLTVISWTFYPIVFLFPMLGLTGAGAAVAVQIGYTVADIVAKAVFGLLIYRIAVVKSAEDHASELAAAA